MNITGTWTGSYTYGPGYEEAANTSVPFRLSIDETWLGRIAGYVRDDASKGGMPERGRIHGRRRGRRIEFVKVMPVGYVTNDDGELMRTQDWLDQQGFEDIQAAAHRIHYAGELDIAGQSMSGSWLIRPRELDGSMGSKVFFEGGEGTWTARRISELPSEI
jgi:hypothetical protein